MNVPFYTSSREYTARKDEFDAAVSHVMEKGDFILGGDVAELEKEIEQYSGALHCIGTANGSDALVIASDICGFSAGAEVITPVFTFFASSSCIARLGGKPVFCDVLSDTCCMDMNQAANLVTKKTKGLLPVHLFTQMADMNACMNIAKQHNLSVIEDAAEAFGMKQTYGGSENAVGGSKITAVSNEYTVGGGKKTAAGNLKTAGTIGDFGVYSFFPTKTLGGYGDGGMITTNSELLYTKAKSMRVHGAVKKYHHEYIGYNSRLDTLQAAVLRVKMQRIDENITQRERHAHQYFEHLRGIDSITLPVIAEGNKPVFYVFNIQAENRDKLQEYLTSHGIGTSIYYPVPLHLQKCFEYLGYKKGDFPVAEKMCTTALALPMFPELTQDEISYTCEKIREFYTKK